MATSLEHVLERTLAALPVTREDLLVRGIAGEVIALTQRCEEE